MPVTSSSKTRLGPAYGLELPLPSLSKDAIRGIVACRPFAESELASRPSPFVTGAPDFVGVGCARSGSTWWYQNIINHPDVVPNRLDLKELLYFVHFGYNGMSEEERTGYHHAFATIPGKICGEWSPVYVNYPLAFDYLAASAPRTKILVLLRNPIDSSLSRWNMYRSRRAEVLELKAEHEVRFTKHTLFPEALNYGLVANGLERLLHHFDREQILVLQYERCRLEPETVLRETYRFLGLEETFVPNSLNRRINQKPYIIDKPNDEARARMARFFASDVEKQLALFPHIDPSLWPEFS